MYDHIVEWIRTTIEYLGNTLPKSQNEDHRRFNYQYITRLLDKNNQPIRHFNYIIRNVNPSLSWSTISIPPSVTEPRWKILQYSTNVIYRRTQREYKITVSFEYDDLWYMRCHIDTVWIQPFPTADKKQPKNVSFRDVEELKEGVVTYFVVKNQHDATEIIADWKLNGLVNVNHSGISDGGTVKWWDCILLEHPTPDVGENVQKYKADIRKQDGSGNFHVLVIFEEANEKMYMLKYKEETKYMVDHLLVDHYINTFVDQINNTVYI